MVKKLKIGILFKQKKQFFDWQIKIIEEILNSDFADIECTFSYKSFFDGTGRTYMFMTAAIIMNILNNYHCILNVVSDNNARSMPIIQNRTTT